MLPCADLECLCVSSTAGMNMSPVSRLKKTWAKVKTAKFDILEVGISFYLFIYLFLINSDIKMCVWS